MGGKSVIDSTLVANLGPFTDEKDAFRQWDENRVNALSHLQKGYGKAMEHIKDLVDQGRDPEDARRGSAKEQMSSVSCPTLADLVLAHL